MRSVPKIQPRLSHFFYFERILLVPPCRGDIWYDDSFLCQLGVGWPRFHYTFADSAHGSLSSFLKTFLGRQETLVGFSFLILTHFMTLQGSLSFTGLSSPSKTRGELFVSVVPKLGCELGIPGKVANILKPRPHPRPVTSESLRVGTRHMCFLKPLSVKKHLFTAVLLTF